MSMGIRGYFAIFVSLYIKAKIIRLPTTRSAMTLAESHGKMAPPKLRPKRTISVKARKVTMPVQSIARMPSTKEVCSWRISRKMMMRIAAIPQIGKLM
jgi:hypothetical protein